MANQQTVNVNIVADTKRFSSAMRGAGNDTDFLTNTLKGFGIAAVAAFTAAAFAATAFAAKSVKSASDLEQSIGGVQAVFKEYAGTVEESSKKAAQSLGLSRDAYNKVATIIGTQLKSSGTTLDALAGKTEDLVTVAADLAATFGGDVAEAANAVTSALRGEFEPLRRFGIALSVAQIEAEALSMTQKELKTDLTAAEKAAAAQSLIFKGAADASGQFAREADSLAGKQQRLNAQLENIQATIGEALLPVVAAATDEFSVFIGELVEKPEFKQFLSDVSTNLVGIMENLPAVVANVSSFGNDALPAVNAFFPMINEALQLMGSLFGVIENSDPASSTDNFAGSMQSLADAFNAVGDALDWINTQYNKLPPFFRSNFFEVTELLLGVPFGGLKAFEESLFGTGNTSNSRADGNGGVKLAEGGIVMPRPGGVQATIAEAGEAEAVIPLSKMGSMGTTVVINGNVGYSAEELAREIARRQAQVNALSGINRLVGVS